MVHGETYYAELHSDLIPDLTNYNGTWELLKLNKTKVDGYGGNLQKIDNKYILEFETSDIPFGEYRVRCFNIFPDGFKDCILDEVVKIV